MSTSTTELLVRDVLLPLDRIPVVKPTTLLKSTLTAMNKRRLGVAAIVDEQGKLLGIFTDGDVRRLLLKQQKPFAQLFADDIVRHATRKPTTIDPAAKLAEAIELMEAKEIWDLPVVEADGTLVGLLHLHPAIKAVMGR
jgi:arabinose-5-phosphate isomerase